MSTTFEPELTVQRQMLEQKRDQFKQAGYDAFLEAEAAKVQDPGKAPGAKAQLEAAVKELEAKSVNAYTAARRMQAMIDALPKEEAKTDAGTDA
jgi:hypothetical protein